MAQVLDLAHVHGELARVEEMDSQLDEGDEEKQMNGRRRVKSDLGGDLVEAEGPCQEDYQDGGNANRGVDADDDAQSEAPCNAARGDAAAELTQERAKDLAAEELAKGSGYQHREGHLCREDGRMSALKVRCMPVKEGHEG